MEQWWNDSDRGKLKYWEENIIQHGWEMNTIYTPSDVLQKDFYCSINTGWRLRETK
jgi:hypothetical protein